MDVIILLVSTINTASIWIIRMVHIAVFERDFHKLAVQVGHDFAEFLTWQDVPVIRAKCRRVRRFTLGVVWFGVSACSYFLVSPVSPEGLPFILALPYDATTPLGFAVSWLFCAVTCLYTVMITMALDALNVTLITQLRIQLTLLSRKIVDLAKGTSEKTADPNGEIHSRLKKCIRHHQTIIRNADLLESTLGAMLLGQSISIGASTCFQMFQLATTSNGLKQVGKSVCYLCEMFSELFVYCWFGDDLITESQKVAVAVYDAVPSLQECPLPIKRSLMLLMNRAQRPLSITARGFFPLCRESFVSVANVSYSFFALLRNFRKDDE
uniref:Olfactory receptor OR54 n=1 Tax=Oedaleus asiaticus TaxID=244712 RepID=A0A410HX46_9ORTH|nr:olfactory receptor OR54 [Oedaleus asiaticus]